MASPDDPPKGFSELIREVKGRAMDYRKSLERDSKPWDREVEFQRQNLRRPITSAMFRFPNEQRVTKLESMLWADTSHTIIDKYRKLVSEMEVQIAKNTGPVPPKGTRAPKTKKGDDGPVAFRKLVARFQGFLATEEKFWTDIVIRYATTFELEQAKPSLEVLSLMATDPEDLVQRAGGADTLSSTGSSPPISQEMKETKLLYLQKCLISLGDLARYRAQYNIAARRPAGRQDRGRGRGAGGRDTRDVKAPHGPDYSKALAFYHQAKLLLPDEGNPSNQLAILSLYGGNHFDAMLHYYRALCVSQPFPTSRENLLKSVDKASGVSKGEMPGAEDSEGHMRSLILELHGHWHRDPTNARMTATSDSVLSAFSSLVNSRSLSPDTIVNIVTMATGALWFIQNYSGKEDIYSQEHKHVAERVISTHVIGLIRVLVTVGQTQIADAVASSPREDFTSSGLARFITATFRRTLPALRMSSRWLRKNVGRIIEQTQGPIASNDDILRQSWTDFWVAYAAFASELFEVFPRSQLPTLNATLEEDIELQGFIPFQSRLNEADDTLPKADSSKMHPNDEHLIRLRDMQADALAIANLENTPIVYSNGIFTIRASSVIDIPRLAGIRGPRALSDVDEVEDDSRTVSTEDPVMLAMDATLDERDDGVEDEEDDEQVVYPHTSLGTPKAHPGAQSLTGTSGSAFPPPLSSAGSPTRPVATGTTAEDLLSRVLGRSSPLHIPTRLRTTSDATAATSSLIASPQFQRPSPSMGQSANIPPYNPSSSLITGAFGSPMLAHDVPYNQALPRFDRAVGGAGTVGTAVYQQHRRSGSFSAASNGLQQNHYLQPYTTSASSYMQQQLPFANPSGVIDDFLSSAPAAHQKELSSHGVEGFYPHHISVASHSSTNAPPSVQFHLPPNTTRDAHGRGVPDHRPWS